MNNSPITQMDEAFVKTARLVVPITQVMKDTLVEVAYQHRVTVAELARASMFHYTETKYPEFGQIYQTKAHALLRENR